MSTAESSATTAATCAYPGCERPVRERAGDSGGKPPKYCDAVNESTGKLAHTALTAARERARLDKQDGQQPATAEPGSAETPASTAAARASSLLEQFRQEARRLDGTLTEGLQALAEAADPDAVSTEISTANRTLRRVQLEADEAVTGAQAERDQVRAELDHVRDQLAEATAARDEAMTDLDSSEAARTAAESVAATTQAEAEQARQEAATQHERAETAEASRVSTQQQLDEHAAELSRVRTEDEQLREQLATATQHVSDLTEARDQLRSDLSQQQQRAQDAEREASQAHGTANQLRDQLDSTAEQLEAARAEAAEHRANLAAAQAELDAARQAVTTEQQHSAQRLTDQREWYEQRISALQPTADQ